MKQNINLQIGIALLFLSALLITLFSACSPLYPLNPWDDANVFLLLGRSLLEGKIPYRDIFDQKGPGVFLIQAACDSVGVRPFFGFYLLEILSLWAYLWFAFQTMLLFTDKSKGNQMSLALIWTCILGFALTTSDFFYYGNTVEEIGLPWIMFTLYILLRYVRKEELPSPIVSILMGCGMGIIFWSKFTVLSPIAGAVIAMFIICLRRHRMCDFWKVMGWGAIGFVGITSIIVSIFIAIGGIQDMLDGYIGYNLFRYHTVGAEDNSNDMRIYPLRLVVWGVLVAIPLLHRRVQSDVRLLVTLSFASTLILFAITTVYIYYFIICFAFFPLCYYYIRKISLQWWTWCIAIGVMLFFTMTDFCLMQRCRGTFPQAILTLKNDVDTSNMGDGVLTYRSRETGIQTYAHIMPPNRFFFLLSVVHQDLKDDQDACLQSHRCRYVIVKDQVLPSEAYLPITDNGYIQIAEGEELFRTLRLLNPTLYFWNLGWTQPLMRCLIKEEPQPQKAIFRLYELK